MSEPAKNKCRLGPCFTESTVCRFYQTKKCLNRYVTLPDGGSNLLEYVEFYRKLGFSIIPLNFKEKTPALASWKEYQARKPTDQEISEWFSRETSVNIGILCGAVSDNLAVIDFDNEEAYRKFFKPDIEKQTLVVKTAKGFHVYLRSRRPVGCFKILELKIDVKGEGGYVVAPPSIHPSGCEYIFTNSEVKSIMEVSDVEEAIWEQAEKLGVKRESFLADKDDLPCVKTILRGVEPGLRNEAGIRLAAYWLYYKHESREVTWDLLKAWNRRNNPPLPDTEIKNIMKSALRGGYEYGCKGFKEIKACDPEIEKNCPIKDALRIKKVEVVKTPFVELSDGRLAEQGYDGKKAYYLVYDPKTGKVTKEDFVTNGDGEIRFEPIMNKDVETGQVLLPSDAVDYGTDKDLWEECEKFLDYWHEEQNRKDRKLDVGYGFTTYITFGKNALGMLPQIGGRRYLGPLGRGKTARMQALGAICYRGFILAGCSTEAAIRRLFELWRGTALMDESDFSRSDLYATIIKILNIGIDAILGWYRCCDENDPSKVLSFYVYGPKILTTRTRFKDPALESRFLTSIARENVSKKPLYRWKKFNQQALELRNKLLMWRFRHYHEIKEKLDQLEDIDIVKKLFGEELNVSSRVKEIIVPIALVVDQETRNVLKEAAIEHDIAIKQIDLEANFEAQVIEALQELKDEEQLDQAALLDHALLERGIIAINTNSILDKMLSKDAPKEARDSLEDRLGKFFRNNQIQVERKRVGKGVRPRFAFIPKDHFLLSPAPIKAGPPEPPGPPSATNEPPKPPPIPVPVPVPEDRQEDWKAKYPDFFTGTKIGGLKASKSGGSLAVCYTCWMTPKNKYQQMLQAGTIRVEPIKPTGEYLCELCRKEPAGYRVIV